MLEDDSMLEMDSLSCCPVPSAAADQMGSPVYRFPATAREFNRPRAASQDFPEAESPFFAPIPAPSRPTWRNYDIILSRRSVPEGDTSLDRAAEWAN